MYDLRNLISPGKSARVTHVVVESDAATSFSPQLSELMSTPAVISLAIEAAAFAVDEYLPEGYVSIGRAITFEHTASTRVGMKVFVDAVVSEVHEQHILLDIKVSDEIGEIGFGTHRRTIVVKDYLDARSKRRAAMQMNSRPM
ncbi:thioesterase [Synergistaceae bacterium OttesenSCG-928-I11]|nr:thioesterase [Synergistaceae bacterium OttesenSCG-928-I11]